MEILAIDPGTKCGYAISLVISGVWDLSVGRHEGGGMRFLKLRTHLKDIASGVGLIVYEEIRGHKGVDAAQIYGGIVAIISEYAEFHSIPYQGIPVGTIKKFATGKGNSNKEAMMEAAAKKWRGFPIYDDNHADALFLWTYANEKYNV